MTDLKERLRGDFLIDPRDAKEAAARIEELEALVVAKDEALNEVCTNGEWIPWGGEDLNWVMHKEVYDTVSDALALTDMRLVKEDPGRPVPKHGSGP